MDKKTIIISPSGKLYGSERVLLDFLLKTRNQYFIYVPNDGDFLPLARRTKHLVKGYNNKNLTGFYFKLLCLLVIHRYKKIYVNEGGHIKYIKVLARIFHNKSFIVHLRIIEDLDKKRLGTINKNIVLVTISDYLKLILHENGYNDVIKINDPYQFSTIMHSSTLEASTFSLSIVGRFTKSKGSALVYEFVEYFNSILDQPIELHIFGNIDPSIEIQEILSKLRNLNHIKLIEHGFTKNVSFIYNTSHAIMHFNRFEPLGRIFFEAIDNLTPLIGFKSGGIGEIANTLDINKGIVEFDLNWKESMKNELFELMLNPNKYTEYLSEAKEKARSIYGADQYVQQIENIIS